MALTRADVERIAHLARLQITAQDVPLYAENLSNILGLVERMSAVDTGAKSSAGGRNRR